MKTIYLIRGVPGAGKSTFAKELAMHIGALHCEADMYHINRDTGVYEWKPENVHAAHGWCQGVAKAGMKAGSPVIISNTFTTEKELKPYQELAESYGYRVVSLIVENRHGNQNVHDVPQETIEAMKNRFTVKL